MNSRHTRFGPIRSLVVVLLAVPACASVDTVRLTSETFPPKTSTEEVEVLDQEPKCPYTKLAMLSMDEGSKYGTMQMKMLEKAAELGADAVVFSRPEKHIEHEIAYQPGFSPWGYGGWASGGYGPGFGYGPYGGLGAGVALPYDVTVKSLTGLAIRYNETTGPRC